MQEETKAIEVHAEVTQEGVDGQFMLGKQGTLRVWLTGEVGDLHESLVDAVDIVAMSGAADIRPLKRHLAIPPRIRDEAVFNIDARLTGSIELEIMIFVRNECISTLNYPLSVKAAN